MHIRWTPAAADSQNISNYLKQHYPHYRQPSMRRPYDTIRSLKQSPHRGRPGTEGGTREILFPPLGRPQSRKHTTALSGHRNGPPGADFGSDYRALPANIRARADKHFALLKSNLQHRFWIGEHNVYDALIK